MKTGKQLKNIGINQAMFNADYEEPEWSEQALKFVSNYPGEIFQTEDVRKFAYSKGLSRPPSERAWGSVISKAKKQKIIEFNGYQNVNNPKAHSTPACVWKKCV